MFYFFSFTFTYDYSATRPEGQKCFNLKEKEVALVGHLFAFICSDLHKTMLIFFLSKNLCISKSNSVSVLFSINFTYTVTYIAFRLFYRLNN